METRAPTFGVILTVLNDVCCHSGASLIQPNDMSVSFKRGLWFLH